MTWHVVAMGGGGFSMSEDGLASALDRYVMELSGVPVPRICFVGTASGDSRRYIAKFHQAFADEVCETTHLELFRRDDSDGLACAGADFDAVAEQDVLYVGGGSTANLLALWRLHGLDRQLRSDRRPRVLCGISAGALCWFEGGVTDSFGPALEPLADGLGLLSGSPCPHYDGQERRRPTYHRAMADGALGDGFGGRGPRGRALRRRSPRRRPQRTRRRPRLRRTPGHRRCHGGAAGGTPPPVSLTGPTRPSGAGTR